MKKTEKDQLHLLVEFCQRQRKWLITEIEAYALVWTVNYFRPYLLGNKFEPISDYQTLVYLRDIKNPTPKIARWLFQLE